MLIYVELAVNVTIVVWVHGCVLVVVKGVVFVEYVLFRACY